MTKKVQGNFSQCSGLTALREILVFEVSLHIRGKDH